MHIPSKKPVVKKVAKKPKRKNAAVNSKSWVALEYKIADILKEYGFNASRIKRERFESIDDINVPECAHVKIDAKYRLAGWAHHSVFVEQVEQYRQSDKDVVVMITKSGNKQNDEMACMKLRDFASLLYSAYLSPGYKNEGLLCPQCGKNVIKGPLMFRDMYAFSCCNCSFEFISQERI
jgi:predicted RNA-binding Zn-ribbon protein involved in translation (DUF1610 family)